MIRAAKRAAGVRHNAESGRRLLAALASIRIPRRAEQVSRTADLPVEQPTTFELVVNQGARPHRAAIDHRPCRRGDRMRRWFVIALLVGIALAPLLSTGAAEPARMFHVGMINLNSPRSAPFNVAFEQRLRELGYVEGQNLAID